jgi:hypothetical protein
VKKAAVIVPGLVSLVLFSAFLGPGPARLLWASPEPQAARQEAQKPKYDYMGAILSRSTRPLGLKEDPALKKMLDQGAIKWAIRAGSRHALD